MIALRLLLGAAEAGIYPALSLIICTFYRRSEQLARLGVVWMGNGVGLIAGGVLTFAIGSMKNTLNLSQWQWMLIILGSVTSFFGIFSFFCLIDNPKSRALGLNAEQEILIEERNRDNAVVRTNKVNKDHILEALGELRLWGFCLVSLINNLQNGAMSVSLRRLTIEYNLKDEQAWVFSVGAGGSIILFTTMAILIVRKTKQLIYCICFMIVIDVVGLLVFEVSTNPVVRLVGFYLTWSYVAIFTLTVSATANNVSGYTKKIFYNAMIMIFYAIGNAIGPYMVPATGSTFLISSVITCVIACTAMFLILVVVRWRMELINRRRLRNSAVVMTNVEDDLTDVQDPNFIYCL
ncbi:major facilitator superfamily domain-containing protein [Spinellus fusiger]|nr:major facilitator superfamily domain-containing protein [Spinellus fusiger]